MSGFCLKVVPTDLDCDICLQLKADKYGVSLPNKHPFYMQICLACINEIAPSFNKETVELARAYQHQQELN